VASPASRSRAALLVVFLAVVALCTGAGAGAWSEAAPQRIPAVAYTVDGQARPTSINAKALASVNWRGGSITASTGEVVNVFVSDALPQDTPEKWAEFMVRLTHGPEIGRVDTRIASLAEVQDLCGGQALGCYGHNEMISFGDVGIDESTPEEVVRHEYGHHIAFHRTNAPWLALDWGPKQWASAMNVCTRVARRQAFPGDGGRNYALNPGEAWAETYRLMDERKNGITSALWPIVDRSFFPTEAAIQAAERDVVQPWAKNRTATFGRNFGRRTKKVWWIPLQTPLDGQLSVSAVVPRGGSHDVALVAANRRTVIRRAQWVGQRSKRTATQVCGLRSLFLRVTQAGALGRVTVSVSLP
jgi:hypothetical protein